MDMTPVIRRCAGWINAECGDGIDCLKHLLDLRPAGQVQQAFAARMHMGNGRAGLAGADRAQNVDARQAGPVVIGRKRMNAKTLSGANETTRRRLSMRRCSAVRPNRIQFSIRPLTHSSSTCVSSAMGAFRDGPAAVQLDLLAAWERPETQRDRLVVAWAMEVGPPLNGDAVVR
jgi:hypothetical protein